MSHCGNDLVRRYLWMAALCAVRFNPAVRALYARVVAKHPHQKAIAIGHGMRKLLHLVFAIWKSKQPFNPEHYPWLSPAHVAGSPEPETVQPTPAAPVSDIPVSHNSQAAGLTRTAEPARKEVTAACTRTIPETAPVDERTCIDFAHLKKQLPLARVLDHLGLTARLRGTRYQQRCACPIHRGDNRGRTFSVNLTKNVFQCFEVRCQQKGDVIDLWAALHGLSVRHAAIDLIRTFALEPAPARATEKRNG